MDAFSEEKSKEAALGVNGHRPQPQQPGVFSAPMYTMGVPGVVMVQPTLPPNLWPHDFLALSTGVAVFTGLANPLFSLPLAVVAIILGFLCRSASAKGNYTSAKNYSNVSIGLLTSAVIVYGSMWFIGWLVGMAYTLPIFIFESG